MQALEYLQSIASRKHWRCDPAMAPYDIRRQRVKQLIDALDSGNYSRFGERTDTSPQTVSRWFQSGKHARNIGEDVARRIEARCGKPRGWLDTLDDDEPLPRVAPLPFAALLALLATHVDTALPANRAIIADLVQRYLMDTASRPGALSAVLPLLPPTLADHRVAAAFGPASEVRRKTKS